MKKFRIRTHNPIRGRIREVVVVVDDQDAPFMRRNAWSLRYDQTTDRFYPYALGERGACTTIDDRYLHRLLMGAGPAEAVIHVDGNELDCRRQNLRVIKRDEMLEHMRRRRWAA